MRIDLDCNINNMETREDNKCKAFTSLEQSRKLAKFLPLESADMCCFQNPNGSINYYGFPFLQGNKDSNPIPCWSLAALLAFLPNSAFLERGNVTELYRITLPIELVPFDWFVEPVDACYEMILKLHELKML